jgi:hypothetical protein
VRLLLSLFLLFFHGDRLLFAAGGELGNAYVPFESKIGRYSLEYAKDWRVNDLSETTSFNENASASETASFFTVEVDSAGSRSMSELLARLNEQRPDVIWTSVNISGLPGFKGSDNSAQMVYLFRAPGDQLILRMFATDGSRSESVLAHMLQTFRVN